MLNNNSNLPNRVWEPTGKTVVYVVPCTGGRVTKVIRLWSSRPRLSTD